MKRSIAAPLLVASMLLVACAPRLVAERPTRPAPQQTETTPDPPSQLPVDLPAPKPATFLKPVSDGVRHTAYKPGEALSASGAYFMDVATGSVDGWGLAGSSWASITPDGLHLLFMQDETHYLVNRETGKAYQFDPNQVLLVTSQNGRLLFYARKGELMVLDQSEMQIGAFPSPFPADMANVSAVISPDGRFVAVAYQRRVKLLSLPDGRGIAEFEVPAEQGSTGVVAALSLVGAGSEAAFTVTQYRQAPLRHLARTEVLRFNWKGEKLADFTVGGHSVKFSPDAAQVLWVEELEGRIAPAVLVGEGRTGTPTMRVRSASLCYNSSGSGGNRWLADGSGFVADGGRATVLVMLQGAQPQIIPIGGRLEPSPGNPNLLASGGTAVLNRDGAVLQRAQIGDRIQAGFGSAWGASSAALQFTLPMPGHDGQCGFPIQLGASVEMAPFGPLTMEVTGTGNCLNVRKEPGGDVVACVADRARLAFVGQTVPTVFGPEQQGVAGHNWVKVRTEQGVEGWTAITSGNLKWAEGGR